VRGTGEGFSRRPGRFGVEPRSDAEQIIRVLYAEVSGPRAMRAKAANIEGMASGEEVARAPSRCYGYLQQIS